MKLPSIPDDPRLLLRIPNELAVATAISSSPSEYFSELVCHRLQTAKVTLDFARAFVSRLLLEKPDFDRSSRVGAGLLALYSLYLESVLREGQMALFVIDRLLPEFRELGNLIRDRIQADHLLDVFDIRERAEGLDGKPVLRLRRRKLANAQPWSKTDTRSMLATVLPPEIWVREDLLGSRSESSTRVDSGGSVGG